MSTYRPLGSSIRIQYVGRLAEITAEIDKLKAATAGATPAPFFWKLRERLLQIIGMGLPWPESRHGDYEAFRSML